MPKGKRKIHDLFSKKIAAKRKRVADINKERIRAKLKPEVPASVDNFRGNKTLIGPHRIKRLVVPVVPRKLSPTEGQATVNGKTGNEVKKLIHKPVSKIKTHDPTAGAIEAKSTKSKKTRGRPRKGTKNVK